MEWIMALQKQPISITFAQGLDTKTDKYQLPVGKFLTLVNSVFTKAGALTKRTGFQNLTDLGNDLQTTLTTLNDNLVATGSDLFAYSMATDQWLNKGICQPVQLSVLSMVRSSTAQVSPDAAITPTGLACITYMDSGKSYYQISDDTTGQQIQPRTLLPSAAINPRVFILGSYFIITFMATISGAATLQYMAIPTANPTFTGVATTISNNVNGAQAGYDAYTVASQLFIAWGSTGLAFKVTWLTRNLSLAPIANVAGFPADLISVTADESKNILWVSYWESITSNGFVNAFDYALNPLSTSGPIITTTTINELTSIAASGTLTVFYETVNTYSYSPNARTDFISTVTVGAPLTLTTPIIGPTTIILRSVGLASKPFIDPITGNTYVLATYGDKFQTPALNDSNQPSYFLIDSIGNIYMRLAYSNGGGYEANQVLPTVSYVNNSHYCPYLIADYITTQNDTTNLTTPNKGTNLPAGTPTNAIYTNTGVNLAIFTLNISGQHSSEIASTLNLTGGMVWSYDGIRPTELGFHVWPENVAGTTSSTTLTPTGMTTLGSNVITAVSSTTGIGIGSTITGTGVPANQVVVSTTPTTITFGPLTATSSNTGVTLTIIGQVTAQEYFYVFTYEWTDNQGNLHRSAPSIPFAITAAGTGVNTLDVPTDRLTYKQPFISVPSNLVPNPIRIVGYRWSVAQQIYYQFTSITSPYLNDTTIDFLTIVDGQSDAQILGNAILYTTGGVVEDICPPACTDTVLFSDRLFLIDAEDQNLLWFSKQVIENTPVEMSDLLTLYIAPTIGAQGSTGVMTALGAMDDKLIIFKKDAIYYINGSGPDNTGANSTFSDPVFITATVGCANPNSVVLMPNGVMFQSDKGIWLLGRDLSTQYIGAPVEGFNSNVVLSATAIPGTNQVRFVLDNRQTLVYDYFFNQWSTHTNISAISATLYQGVHTYLNTAGQIFQETPNTYVDGAEPVLMSLTTSWINIAGLQGFERFYFANLLGTYYTPFKLNVGLAYNYNDSAVQTVLVTPDNYAPAWGGEALWGSGGPWGGSEGNVFTARVFPSTQKCSSFQVTIQELYDPTLGPQPGQGLSLSGLLLNVGIKKGTRTQSAQKSFGG
jgi:hypothetical protein